MPQHPRARSRSHPLTAAVLAAAVLAALLAPATAAAQPVTPPNVDGTQTVPVYDYADAIRESVWVEAEGLDSDEDGEPDRIAVDVIRPREAAEAGQDVPAVMMGSPYFDCCGRGNEGELKQYDENGLITAFPMHYDNYFVPRGYAYVAADLAGTNRSTGCMDVGGSAEVTSARAVIDWLNGRATAYDADGQQVVADWTNGRVGMIGKSWDGSVANGVAATGVEGLETIVPLGAISSWYDYQRYNGVLRSSGYPTFLAEVVNGRPEGVCDEIFAAEAEAADDATGSYNAYWAERDFRPDADRVTASVFVVHGVNDLNVTTTQFGAWWDALADAGVTRKIWLTQTGHIDPFDFRRAEWVDTLHRWFDHELYDLDNGILDEPMADIERPDGSWTTEDTWPAANVRTQALHLGDGDGTTGVITPRRGGAAEREFTDVPELTEGQVVADPSRPLDGRLSFLSGPLRRDLRLSGTPSVTLRVQVDRPTTTLTARLTAYGERTRIDYASDGEGIRDLETESCWGESSATDDSCYIDTAINEITTDVYPLTRGWMNAAHHASLELPEPLQPGRWYTITVPFNTYDTVIPAGHVLGLAITQSDLEYTEPDPTGATVRVDLAGSRLDLPISAGAVPAVAQPAVVDTERSARAYGTGEDWRRPEFR
ncbi:Xaa-Pro dipeptidyl-peptidase [Allonocardiopsis opalescens]|uniref:X-Pro dipeptidyl-peptidase n=1 Tax=Allonocardiopsis opalescens TaxID=1144618 RepID=A0A2T0PVQ3_9ACTN|nr:Xaa-Pro dipeptidyl-peptidase [Allonocardiopsis opalescens]PRX95438.1 X-Pro dipeptidyl-peptidase [Allonocardiopsis opalescens]